MKYQRFATLGTFFTKFEWIFSGLGMFGISMLKRHENNRKVEWTKSEYFIQKC